MKKTFVLATLLMLSACATIVGDKTQLINFKSSPSEASITITDEKGAEIFKGTTPTNVTLRKSDGSYFGGKTFVVAVEKSGYQTVKVTLDTKMNGWYAGGNLLFGGLIGWLIVDPFTGAMYTIKPENVDTQLAAQGTSGLSDEEGLHVVLLEEVPSSLHASLEKLN